MFILTLPTVWSIFYLLGLLYSLAVLSFILYFLPTLAHATPNSGKTLRPLQIINGLDLQWILLLPHFSWLILMYVWCSYPIAAWFGHLVFSAFHYKLLAAIMGLAMLLLTVYMSIFYYTSHEIYDFLIVQLNCVFWLMVLFITNTVFTVIFVIEILSTLLLFLVIAVAFTSTYSNNNLNLTQHLYFQQTTPYFYILTIIYFFWITLLASTIFYLFLLLFYIQFFTFDWFLFDFILIFLLLVATPSEIVMFGLIWFGLLFSIFLKLGLVPFFIWKPIFFKGLPIFLLFFYVTIYYYLILLFLSQLFLQLLHELFTTYIVINIGFLLLGFNVLLTILCEAFFVKTFLAISSILNTLFVFLIFTALNGVELVVYI